MHYLDIKKLIDFTRYCQDVINELRHDRVAAVSGDREYIAIASVSQPDREVAVVFEIAYTGSDADKFHMVSDALSVLSRNYLVFDNGYEFMADAAAHYTLNENGKKFFRLSFEQLNAIYKRALAEFRAAEEMQNQANKMYANASAGIDMLIVIAADLEPIEHYSPFTNKKLMLNLDCDSPALEYYLTAKPEQK